MVERNLIREGYIYNTLTPLGTISGSQTVSAEQIDALFDGDVSTTAVLVSGTKFISLDADLGARWKLRRVELYTDETVASNFDMSVSDNNIDFTEITMTGTAPLWVGDIPDSTISGAPRYLRYEHRTASNRIVREWKAINDDSLVDFGAGGNQTSLTLQDAPIGTASAVVTPLELFNRYTKPAEAFVFVDRTDNAAQDELEISTSPSGPWVGWGSSTASQPDLVPWETGEFVNTRVVPTGSYYVDFASGSLKGWVGSGASVSPVGGAIRATSTALSPQVRIENPFVTFTTGQLVEALRTTYANYFTFRAADVDKVKVRARVVSALPSSNLVEGARLFWRAGDLVSGFPTSLSTTSQLGNQTFTGEIQEFIFDVGAVPTWSGTIRGFSFQPFTVATGTGLIFDFYSIEAYSSSGNYVGLDYLPVASGVDAVPLTVEDAISEGFSFIHSYILYRQALQQDCIITKVKIVTETAGAIFLARIVDPTNLTTHSPNKFVVTHAARLAEVGTGLAYMEVPVFWEGKRGDVLGYGLFSSISTAYTTETAVAGDTWVATSGAGAPSSLSAIQATLNFPTWAPTARRYLLSFEAISTELLRQDFTKPLYPTGTYTTPVFDSGATPALNMFDFDSTEPVGTSIDSLTQAGVRTVKARASEVPARTNLTLGELGTVSSTVQTTSRFLNLSYAEGNQVHESQLNTKNGTVSARESTTVVNVGGTLFYHEQKDELWVLNVVLSGTSTFDANNARPTWDVFNPHTGDYIRTQHVTGDLLYAYTHPSSEVSAFEPVGFVADYGRDEIYIFQRENAFFVGAGSYYGIILDMEGNFRDVFWRDGAIGVPNSNRFQSVRSFTYAPTLQDTENQTTVSGIFFTLNDNADGSTVGDFITAYRHGTNASPGDITYINEKQVSTIPKLTWATTGTTKSPGSVVWNPVDSRLYLLFPFTDSLTIRNPYWYSLDVSYNSGSNAFEYIVVASGAASGIETKRDGYSRGVTNTEWVGIRERQLTFNSGAAYVRSKDTFALLQTFNGDYSIDYPTDDFSVFNNHPMSYLQETGAGIVIRMDTPESPSPRDALWGSISGTLPYQNISTEGINFPPGKFSQLQYQLNATLSGTLSPKLSKSTLSSGLRVGTVPASGTRTVYVRTNIPSSQSIGDQVGRLKVYWEIEE